METHITVKNPKTMAFVLMSGAFIGLFNETSLNMALSNIMKEFSITAGVVQWLTTGYLLTLGIFVPISALLIKWFSTRQLITVGLVFSILGTIFAAISINFPMLFIARMIQALGTGILLPVMMNVILLIFPRHKRGTVMGMMGLVITTAPAIGPTISGFIITAFRWNDIFWLSLFFYIIITLFGLPKIENVSKLTKPAIDYLSILFSTVGFGGVIYALSSMAERPFLSFHVAYPFIIGVAVLGLFIFRQLHMKQPVINLRVFAYPMFTLGSILLFLAMIIILASGILIPLYLKGALILTAASAGLMMLPGNLLNTIMSPIVGILFNKIGARIFLIFGFSLIFIAALLFVINLSHTTAPWLIIIYYMLMFFGLSFIVMPAQTNALNQLPQKLYPDGSAAMNTLQQVAGAAGTAIAVTLMISGQKAYALANNKAASEEILAAGTKHAFVFIACIALIGLTLSFFIRKKVTI